jgi:hypothetical protein
MSAEAEQSTIYDFLSEAETKLLRVRDLLELVFMAGESLHQPWKNAITAGADTIDDILMEAVSLIEQAQSRAREGRSI